MKRRGRFHPFRRRCGPILLAIGAACAPTVALAQPGEARAQGNATAEIVEPLTVTAVEDLRFGGIAGSANQAGTVTVMPDGEVVFMGGATATCSGAAECSRGAALFAVRGTGGRNYQIALPAEVVARSAGGGQELRVHNLTVASANRPDGVAAGLLDNAGQDRVRVGGTLDIPPATVPGNYSAEVPIVVSYG